ncbi:hypothetical protein V8E53_014393 [Lactarius tabidus]
MSTVTPTSPTFPVVSLDNLLFDYPGADVILRSCDSYKFRVLNTYIFHSSPVLGERVLAAELPQSGAAILTDTAVTPLPVALLPDNGAILFSLLTYIFPVQPILPSTVEQVMELLSAAENYKMDSNSLYIYSLAQKYCLRHEVLQAARSTLCLPTLTIDSLDEGPQSMPGVFLHELWKYHQRVRANLKSDLYQFVVSRAHAKFELLCRSAFMPAFGWLSWVDKYILSIERNPSLFDLSAFHMALTSHIQSQRGGCKACATTPSKAILEFWAALTAIYCDSITKAELELLLVVEETNFEGHTKSPEGHPSQLRCTDMLDADLIIRSSDDVNFRIRRSILAASSPFFGDLFSLPQPSDHELVDGLPVVPLPGDAEVLDSLITFLYPVPPELPTSEDKILTLLAACRKYDMTTIQSSIRDEVSCRGLLSPKGAETFRTFAVAYRKRLIPEMKAAARLTLGYLMTFDSLGEALRSFEGCALFDLSRFHRLCRDGITSLSKVFLDSRSGPSKVWVGCPTPRSPEQKQPGEDGGELPIWFDAIADDIFQRLGLAFPLVKLSGFREVYLEALWDHVSENDCTFCMKVHTMKGEEFCAEIEKQITQVWNMKYLFSIEAPESKCVSPPSPVSIN